MYEEKWSNVQLLIYDPTLYGNLGFLTNGPTTGFADSKGGGLAGD